MTQGAGSRRSHPVSPVGDSGSAIPRGASGSGSAFPAVPGSNTGSTGPRALQPLDSSRRAGTMPYAVHEAPSARQLGHYVLGKELGRGSNGVVFEGRHEVLGKPVAIKVLLGGAQDAHALGRFKIEASAMCRIEHPGVVGVFDFGLSGGHPYYVMELCRGETLRQRLTRGPLPVEEARALVAELAGTVAAAHELNVIHRDLKPANVLLDERARRSRVTDFGLAQDGCVERMTKTGEILGTPVYMAPEQVAGRRDVDRRIDVYALGVILYECLTGQVPYQGASWVDLCAAIDAARPAPPRKVRAEVPAALEAVCLRAMAKDPAERYQDAAGLEAALQALAPRAAPGEARAAEAPGDARARVPLGAWIAAAALAIVGGAGLALGVASRWQPKQTAAADERERGAGTPEVDAAGHQPSERPSERPSEQPSAQPGDQPSDQPAASAQPSSQPSPQPSPQPKPQPSRKPRPRRPPGQPRGVLAQVSAKLLGPLREARKAAGQGQPVEEALAALKGLQQYAETEKDLAVLELEAVRLLFRRSQFEQVVARVPLEAGPQRRLLRACAQAHLGRKQELDAELKSLETLGGGVGDVARALRLHYLEDPREPGPAADLCEQALDTDESLWVARHLRCFALLAADRNVLALGEVGSLVAEYPDDAAALYIQGVLKFTAGNLDGAYGCYSAAHRLGRFSGMDFDLAETMVLKKVEPEQAQALLDAWIQRYPTDVHARLLRGILKLRQGDRLGATTELAALAISGAGDSLREKVFEYMRHGWLSEDEMHLLREAAGLGGGPGMRGRRRFFGD
ncbi:MAG: protein kinase [Planctomycetota bacterium]